MQLFIGAMGILLAVAFCIELWTIRREHRPKRDRRPWWNEREDGPEGDH